ncbi:MAG: pseudaminic acid synthase [Gammaproteobacteria bacterium]|nr:pseudaminic acid synthase [Gammaproteobacteria bacterium]
MVYIVAELSANHNQSLETAIALVDAAADSGADAIKVQTFKPESLTLNVDHPNFAKLTSGSWAGWKPWDLYQRAAMPYDWHAPLQSASHRHGMEFFSSPFDEDAVDFLESLNVPRYKIASFEINHIPLIRRAADTQKPIIMSTGVASIEDITLAVETCKAAGNHDITLLKCTSQYPAKIEDANLATLSDLARRFDTKIGLSDHTMDNLLPVMSVAMGSCMIEKHLTLSREDGGVDSGFSLEPEEFKSMVTAVRQAQRAMGNVNYQVTEQDQRRKRSLFAKTDIVKGERISPEQLAILRPNLGAEPRLRDQIVGRPADRDYRAGDAIQNDEI